MSGIAPTHKSVIATELIGDQVGMQTTVLGILKGDAHRLASHHTSNFALNPQMVRELTFRDHNMQG